MKRQISKILKMIVLTLILSFVTTLLAFESNNTSQDKSNESSTLDDRSKKKGEKIEFAQPDGTKLILEVFLGGRNNPSFLLQKNGFTVVYDPNSKYFCWARQSDNGRLESTKYPVHLHNPELLGLEKDIRMSDDAANAEEERLRKNNPRLMNNRY